MSVARAIVSSRAGRIACAPLIAFLLIAAASAPSEEFFIVSSVDVARSRLVLKRPTEVTEVAAITPSTQIRGERGEHLRLAELRAGDTVYAVTSPQPDGQLVAIKIRRGPMTVEELHRRYLDRRLSSDRALP